MPPVQEFKSTPVPTAPAMEPTHPNKAKYFLAGIVAVASITAFFVYLFLQNPDEATAATFQCGDNLSWSITKGESTSETYGGQINSRLCEYSHLELSKNGSKVFSVSNFTDCRDFKSWEDLYNGIDEPFYEGHQTFPAGHPIVAAVAIPDVVIPPAEPEEFGDTAYQLGFQISTKSGLTPQEFVTASKCILDHRNQLQDTFGDLHYNSGALSWLALVDETASFGHGDLAGGGQVYSCSNKVTYRASGESLFALNPGQPAEKMDEFGLSTMNDKQVAVIGFDGKLYEPNRVNSAVYISLPYADHRLVDESRLPAPLSSCVNDRGATLADYFALLKNNTIYEPSPENYTPQSTTSDDNSENLNSSGIAPTESQNADCKTWYATNVNSAAIEYGKSGGEVSQALFYSPSLSKCVGVVQIVQDNVTNYQTFDAATGVMLNVTDTAIAFQDWSLSSAE